MWVGNASGHGVQVGMGKRKGGDERGCEPSGGCLATICSYDRPGAVSLSSDFSVTEFTKGRLLGP